MNAGVTVSEAWRRAGTGESRKEGGEGHQGRAPAWEGVLGMKLGSCKGRGPSGLGSCAWRPGRPQTGVVGVVVQRPLLEGVGACKDRVGDGCVAGHGGPGGRLAIVGHGRGEAWVIVGRGHVGWGSGAGRWILRGQGFSLARASEGGAGPTSVRRVATSGWRLREISDAAAALKA